MSNLLNGIAEEWKHLLNNKLLIISTFVLFLIPIMYGGFFLGSIWDPYGKTDQLPVAVVNLDEPTEINSKPIHIGQDIVSKLEGNHSLKWEFVSGEQAQKGLENGHYYMAITIPKDFSHNAASITSQSPQQSTLRYTVTPSKNYIGSLISNQAAEKVVENVKTTLTHEYSEALLKGFDTIRSGMATAAQGSEQLANGSHQLTNGLQQYYDGTKQFSSSQTKLRTGVDQLAGGANNLSNGLNQLSAKLPSDAQVSQLVAGTNQVKDGLNQLYTSVNTTDPTVQQLQNNILNEKATIASDQSALQSLIPQLVASGQLTPSGASTLQSSFATLQNHTATLNTDSQKLSEYTTIRQQQLKNSVNQLNGGMSSLTPQLTAALNGYSPTRQSVAQLSGGAATISNGLGQLSAGSGKLQGGAAILESNAHRLADSAAQIENGNDTLSQKLRSAATSLSLQPTGGETANQISNPIHVQKEEKGVVPNYGFALAPYVLALGLYVGALVFSVIYPVRMIFGKPKTALEWFLSKWSVATTVGIGQVLVLGGSMVLVLGLNPVNPLGFFAMLLAGSWAFMAITLFFAIAFNNPGRFLAMLLLVLQLGGSEGTFPLATAPQFFQAINPWLPMTYVIRGLRQTISGNVGGDSLGYNILIVLAFAIVFSCLLYGFLVIHKIRPFKHASVDGD